MKKLLVFILTAILSISFYGCNKNEKTLNVTVVDGAPLFSVLSLLDEEGVKLKVVSSAELAIADITNQSCDMAVLPINVASKLYNGGLDVKLLSVNVFGVLHLLGFEKINSFSQLINQTVYNIGKGGTPDITLKYLLKMNNVSYTEDETDKENKVLLKYVSDASTLIPLFKNKVAKYGVLGQPAVENAISKVEGLNKIFDLTLEYKKHQNLTYTQAGVVVSGNTLKNNTKMVKKVYDNLSNNKDYLLNNVAKLSDIVKNLNSSIKVNFNIEIINSLNVDNKSAYATKQDIEKYLFVILEFAPKMIGDKLPDNNFYIDIESI